MKILPLVLLPGTGCNDALWSELLPELPTFIQPVMPDLLSCTSVDAMLEQIAELPQQQFALLGFSMGGYLAQAFYAKYPERISQLILMCCTGEGYSATYREKRSAIITKFANDPKLIISDKYLAPFLDQDLPNADQTKLKLITMLNTVGAKTICRQMQITLQRENYYAELQKCQVPRLVVGARHDQIAPPSHIEKLAQALHTQPQWLDCGHMVPLEMPDALGQLLTSWIRDTL